MYTLAKLPPDDQGCLNILVCELYPDGLICPWEGHNSVLVRLKYLWCRLCRRKWSLKKMLGFTNSKLGWRQLISLVTCWQGKLSPGDIFVATGLAYPTTQRWLERLRSRLPVDISPLSGLLETDQSWPGHKKHGNQALIMGLLDRDGKDIRLAAIPDMEQDSVEGFLDAYAEVGSLIYADAHASHLSLEDVGYGLVLCNHDRGHFGPTNGIEGVWSSFDRFVMRTRDRFLVRFLPGLLQEFQARTNHSEWFTSPYAYIKKLQVFRFS